MSDSPDTTASLRWGGYALLLAIAAGNMLGHIAAIDSPNPRHGTPFLSANDRSRWANVRSLAENGTYAIDDVITDNGWDSIDKVWHAGPDGKFHYYSSKPPLLATIVAGEYWVAYNVTGITLSEHPYYMGRLLLVLTNVLPLLLALVLMTLIIEQYGETDLGRLFAVAALTSGTFLSTFAVTLNNHVPAAVCVAIFLFAGLRIWNGQCTNPLRFAAMGFFGALTAAFELPALSFFALATIAFLWRFPRETLLLYVPAAAVVVAGALGTNWLAHGTLKPAYDFRGDGPRLFDVPASLAERLTRGEVPSELSVALASAAGETITPDAKTLVREKDRRWEILDESAGKRFLVIAGEGKGDPLHVHAWGNWYDYPGSYWGSEKMSPIDRGEPSIFLYALHCTVGHHGVFSLSPIWIAAFLGLGMLLVNRDSPLRAPAAAAILLTIVCLVFYLFFVKPIDRNYGGMTCGLRWFFWLYPLWTLGLIPAADWMARDRWRWAIAVALLVISVLSANFGAGNPWQHPWIYQWLEVYGLVGS